METINEYPKIMYTINGTERIVANTADEDAARQEGFVTVAELNAGDGEAKPATAATKKGK